jgi:[ribosomal protein S18]-alanine N-acetyltransferase
MIKIRYADINDSKQLDLMLSEFDTKVNFDDFSKYLIIEDKEIVGFLNYYHFYDKIDINYIYVKPIYRKKGYADNLMEYLINLNDYTDITLEVKESNISAINLYKKHGFIVVAKRKNYYNSEDGFLMHKKR